MINLRDTADGCTLPVRVHPGAKRNAVTGIHDGALKISLTTPPTDGRANDSLVAFLATCLKLPRASISLLTGLIFQMQMPTFRSNLRVAYQARGIIPNDNTG